MTNTFYNTIIQITIDKSSFKWGVIVSGELMFLENYGNCDITNTVALLLWRHQTISHYNFWYW